MFSLVGTFILYVLLVLQIVLSKMCFCFKCYRFITIHQSRYQNFWSNKTVLVSISSTMCSSYNTLLHCIMSEQGGYSVWHTVLLAGENSHTSCSSVEGCTEKNGGECSPEVCRGADTPDEASWLGDRRDTWSRPPSHARGQVWRVHPGTGTQEGTGEYKLTSYWTLVITSINNTRVAKVKLLSFFLIPISSLVIYIVSDQCHCVRIWMVKNSLKNTYPKVLIYVFHCSMKCEGHLWWFLPCYTAKLQNIQSLFLWNVNSVYWC